MLICDNYFLYSDCESKNTIILNKIESHGLEYALEIVLLYSGNQVKSFFFGKILLFVWFSKYWPYVKYEYYSYCTHVRT